MNADIVKLFQSPTNAYRAKPFWSWNGQLEKDELLRQVHVIKEMGFGGYFMHSRTGLATEYLGKEWFDLINACADEGEKLGLESWLYDEDRWPSGTAGGMVTKDHQFRLNFIRCSVKPGTDFQWNEAIFKAYTCDIEGMNYTNLEEITRDIPVADFDFKAVISFSIEQMKESSFYNGETYADLMNADTTARFIEITHEVYKSECEGRIGKSILGIFTDEPHRGALMDGFSMTTDEAHWIAPWTTKLPEYFQDRFGYDILEKLPEVFLFPEGQRISQVKWHYVELLQQLFLENWAEPCDKWCRENNLILTGHILHEDSLTAQTAMCGSVMRYYEHMEYPGIDLLTEGNRCFWVAKQLQSAARQVGREWLLSELDGCTGWQMPFEGHKAIGDWQALFGINLRCPHLSWYTMQGEAKRDFPASIFHQSAWWREYEHLETYYARIAVLMNQGTPQCDVLVLNPIESLWCQIYPGWSRWLSAQHDDIRKIEKNYVDMFHCLMGAQIDFDYGDEDMLMRMGGLDTETDTPRLRLGKQSYRAVVVSGMVTIRSTTLELLEAFEKAGGTVIFAGEAPAYVDALKSNRALALQTSVESVDAPSDALVSLLKTNTPQYIAALKKDGTHQKDIFTQSRKEGENTIVMAINTSRENWHHDTILRVFTDGHVQEWDCVSGERFAVKAMRHEGYLDILTDFPPVGEKLYVITTDLDTALPVRTPHTTPDLFHIDGPFDYTLGEPNVCVLDRAMYRIDEGDWQEEQEILKVDRTIRTALGMDLRGGEMVQPWFRKKFHPPLQPKAKLALRFQFHVEYLEGNTHELVLENPEKFSIRVNGQKFTHNDVTGWWIDVAFKRLTLPDGLLRVGENLIELEADFHEHVDLESLYLLGNFGVRIDDTKRTLVPLPEKIAVGSLVEQNLPFYSGPITLKLKPESSLGENDQAILSIPKFQAACLKVKAEGKEPQIIAWQPYEADITEAVTSGKSVDLEIVLTRRNLFGPLHQVPLDTPGYGPNNFITEGDNFSDNYMLYPAGLLERPEIKLRKFAP